jgi:hypothetical protein
MEERGSIKARQNYSLKDVFAPKYFQQKWVKFIEEGFNLFSAKTKTSKLTFLNV